MSVRLERVSCALCGSREFRPLTVGTDERLATTDLQFTVGACGGCGMVFTNPRVAEADFDTIYPTDYHAAVPGRLEDWLLRLSASAVIDALKARGAGRRVLEIGCGAGRLLTALQHAGFDVHGLEPARDACEFARRTLGDRVRCEPIERCSFPEHSFDTILMMHVLEHIGEPVSMLQRTRRLLAPHGALVVEVPNYDSYEARFLGPHWLHLDLPRHLFHFTPATLRATLNAAGFVVKEVVPGPVTCTPVGAAHSFRRSRMGGSATGLLVPFVAAVSLMTRAIPALRTGVSIRAFCTNES